MPSLVLRQCLLLALYLNTDDKIITESVGSKIPDSVISLQADPVRNGLVLLLLDSKGSLGSEGLVRRLKRQITLKLNARNGNTTSLTILIGSSCLEINCQANEDSGVETWGFTTKK